VEATVLGKRRIQYEEEISQDPHNYDVWFDYVRLEEDVFRAESGSNGETAAVDRVREVYERAVAQVPPASEKRYWRRYIFLWLNYALFEEIETKVSKLGQLPTMYPLNHMFLRILREHVRSMGLQSNLSPTNDLPSLNYGLCSLDLRYGKWIYRPLERSLEPVSGCAQRKHCSKVISNLS